MIKNILALLLLAFPLAAQNAGNQFVGSYTPSTLHHETFDSLAGVSIFAVGGATASIVQARVDGVNLSNALSLKFPAGGVVPHIDLLFATSIPPRVLVPEEIIFEYDIMQSKDTAGQTYRLEVQIICDPTVPCGSFSSLGIAGPPGTWHRTHPTGPSFWTFVHPIQVRIILHNNSAFTAPVEILIDNLRIWDENHIPVPGGIPTTERFVWRMDPWEIGQIGAQVICKEPEDYQNHIFLIDGARLPVGISIPGVFGEYYLTANAIPIPHITSAPNPKRHTMPSPGLTIPNDPALVGAPLYFQGFAIADPSASPPAPWPQLFTRLGLVYIVDPSIR